MMTSKTLVLLAVPLLVAGTVATSAVQRPTPRPAIPSPTTWVPFTADMVIQDPGRPAVHGKYWRRADGSTRTESWRTDMPRDIVVSIKNVQRELYYYNEPTHWNVAPMKLPPGGYHPGQFREGHPSLTKYNRRLAIRRGDDGSFASDVGFEAYAQANASGSLNYLIPELNFFPVVRNLATGKQVRYFNIELVGELDDALFQPPSSVTPKQLDKPMGIEWVPLGQEPQGASHEGK